MAYCRFGEESTVYAYASGDGEGNDVWIIHTTDGTLKTWDLESFRVGLTAAVAAGEVVPAATFDRIAAELRGEDFSGDSMRALADEVATDIAAGRCPLCKLDKAPRMPCMRCAVD